MKTITFLLLHLSISLTAVSQDKILRIEAEFPSGSARSVQINNKKNVAIHLIPWSASTVKISFDCDTSVIHPKGAVNDLASYNFEVKRTGGKLMIISEQFDPLAMTSNTDSSVTPFRNKLTIYFPKQKKLVINNANNGDITLPEDAVQVDINIVNGSLQTKAISKLSLKSVFADIKLGTIDNGIIDINGGQLSIEKINQLTIISRYTQPKITVARVINMKSHADHYSIQEVETLTGTKVFGSCIIGTVKQKIDLNSKGIGLQISEIKPEVRLIKLNSINDTLSLPVSNLKNYLTNINMVGGNKIGLTDSASHNDSGSKSVTAGGLSVEKIRRSVGDTKNQHTVFDINCVRCVIKFN